uniref:Dirigent protein n=1 Tax=Steinernema glaseri TaxID=37863 RepID=A0A1I7ZLZ7_9BILA
MYMATHTSSMAIEVITLGVDTFPAGVASTLQESKLGSQTYRAMGLPFIGRGGTAAAGQDHVGCLMDRNGLGRMEQMGEVRKVHQTERWVALQYYGTFYSTLVWSHISYF